MVRIQCVKYLTTPKRKERINSLWKHRKYGEGPEAQENFERGMTALFKVPKADIVTARKALRCSETNMSSRNEALAKLESWRSFQTPLRWTIFPSPHSDSSELRAEIDFVEAERRYVRIWHSEKFMRSFSLDGCEVTVTDKSVNIVRPSGERYLLAEEKTQ